MVLLKYLEANYEIISTNKQNLILCTYYNIVIGNLRVSCKNTFYCTIEKFNVETFSIRFLKFALFARK